MRDANLDGRRPRAAVAWSVVAAVLAIEIVSAVLWYSRFLHEGLRAWLTTAQFWSLEAAFLGFAIAAAMAVPRMIRSLGLSRNWWIAGIVLAAGATIVALTVPPRTSRILYDELIYQDVAQNLTDLHRAQMCNDGVVQHGQLQCLAGEYNKEPNGYPYLLSVGYRLFGARESVAFAVNALAHGLLVLALFVAGVRLTGDPRAGFFAGLTATLLPEQLRWSGTAAAEPTSALWCMLAVLAAVEFCRTRSGPALAWVVCTSALAVQFRPESILILPVIGLLILLEAPSEILRPRMGWAVAGGIALLFVHTGHMIAVRQESWGTVGPALSPIFFSGNLRVNLWFYLADHRFPVWVVPAAAVGLLFGAGSFRSKAVTAIYALVFWGIFLFFYAGSYNYGADVRYSLTTFPPLALLAGLGLAVIVGRLRPAWCSPRTAIAVVTVALVWTGLWQVPYVRAAGEEGWGARADVDFARRVSRDLPADALVLTQDPNMFLLWGHDAQQMSFAPTDVQALEDLLARRGGHVYLHWGFWCNVADPRQIAFCTDALARFPHELVREYRERDYRYAFYQLSARPK